MHRLSHIKGCSICSSKKQYSTSLRTCCRFSFSKRMQQHLCLCFFLFMLIFLHHLKVFLIVRRFTAIMNKTFYVFALFRPYFVMLSAAESPPKKMRSFYCCRACNFSRIFINVPKFSAKGNSRMERRRKR